MIDGITTRVLTSTVSHESSRPSQRPRNPAGEQNDSSVVAGNEPLAPGSAAVQSTTRTVQQLAAELGTALNKLEGDFSVSVDKDSGMVVIRITDSITGEVVRQVPPKELLEADRSMERIVGLIVDDQA
jgi:flagellar protein FlaG